MQNIVTIPVVESSLRSIGSVQKGERRYTGRVSLRIARDGESGILIDQATREERRTKKGRRGIVRRSILSEHGG